MVSYQLALKFKVFLHLASICCCISFPLDLISASSAGGCLACKYFASSAPSLRRAFTGLSKNKIIHNTHYITPKRRYKDICKCVCVLLSFTYTSKCKQFLGTYKLSMYINTPTYFSNKLPSLGENINTKVYKISTTSLHIQCDNGIYKWL